MPRLLSLLSFIIVLLMPAIARAAFSARLAYGRGAGAEACPDEAGLRSAVAARLGYDPFFPWAPRTISASIVHEEGRLRASVKLVDDRGRLLGGRRLDAADDECGELVVAIALAISIALDPSSALATEPPPSAPPAADPPPPAVAPPAAPPPAIASTAPPPIVDAPAPSPPRDSGPTVHAGIGAIGSIGAAPALTVGAALYGGLRWRITSIALEGRADLPASQSLSGGGTVTASLLVGSLVPCLHRPPILACAVASVGSLQARGDALAVSRNAQALYLAAGARAGVELSLTDAVYLRFFGDLLANITRHSLVVDSGTVYRQLPLSAGLGSAVGIRF